ncbi:MAG: hypothetical protein IJ446_07540 [Oscillospiraceae bacterium]|nr:hypothetical protein [Oscillospiraceae bacterium]
MSTDRLLVIGNRDYSEYITENDLRIRYTPVYDENTEFTAMNGNVSKTLIGHRVNISFSLADIDEAAAKDLTASANNEKTEVTFAFPDEKTAEFEFISLTLEPERISEMDCRWFASAVICSDVMPLDGL